MNALQLVNFMAVQFSHNMLFGWGEKL